jgi:hypothetical protein
MKGEKAANAFFVADLWHCVLPFLERPAELQSLAPAFRLAPSVRGRRQPRLD